MHTSIDTQTASVSPSLRTAFSTVAAYEIKFMLGEDLACDVESKLLKELMPDPHSDPTLGGMYAISSLGCDDAGFGVMFRERRMRNRKYRVRRYGNSEVVYLERKRSRDGRVRKRRVEARVSDLGEIAAGRAGDVSHGWFVREVLVQGLAPVCRVRYLRRALFGVSAEGPMRVTFDRNIRGSLAPGWTMDYEAPERRLLDGVVICEFKFHESMPGPMKRVIEELKLQATGVSKYRSCVRAFAHELGLHLPETVSPASIHGGGMGVGVA